MKLLYDMGFEDIDDVVNLIAESMNEKESEYARETFENQFDEEGSNRESFIYCDDEQNIIGICGLHFYDWGPEENIWLSWFVVKKSEQGKGIGTQMLKVIEDYAELKFDKLFIETYDQPDFESAKSFYDKMDYEIVGSIKDYMPDGASMIVYMKRFE